MKEANCGCLPVGIGAKPQGVITDRDIVVRALAEGKNPAEAKVADFMTDTVESCSIDDSLADVAGKMRDMGVGRLLVVDRDDTACGIITFGRILRNHDDAEEISVVVASATGRTADMPAPVAKSAEAARQAH
jgi:CBS domain-containing protein